MSAQEKSRDKDKGGVTIALLGREFRVACPEGEERQLMAAVDYLNRKLADVRDNGKVTGNERIALMAALNIAHECLSNPGKGGGTDNVAGIRRRIVAMEEAVDAALAADQENLF